MLHFLLLAAALAAPPTTPGAPSTAAWPQSAPGAVPATTSPSQVRPPATAQPPAPRASPAPAGASDVAEPLDVVPVSEAPPEWSPAIRKAEGAARDFQQALRARLGAAMAQGGPPAAIEVCSTEAQRISSDAAAAAGVKLGRTSDRLRNPSNVAPAWARTLVSLPAGEKASQVAPIAADLGGSVGVLFPIGVSTGCLACHGPPASLSPKVTELLSRSYPRDRAVGYADGDFRGWVWVEVRK